MHLGHVTGLGLYSLCRRLPHLPHKHAGCAAALQCARVREETPVFPGLSRVKSGGKNHPAGGLKSASEKVPVSLRAVADPRGVNLSS